MNNTSSLGTKEDIREKTITEHLWIVNYMAKKYSSGNKNLYEELKSVGNIGLVKAYDRYDENLGTSFSTYATLHVQGEIRHYLRDNADMIRIPRKYYEYYKKIQDVISKYISDKGIMPNINEIITISGISKEIVLEALEAGFAKYPISLEEPVNSAEEDIKLVDTITNNRDESTLVIDKVTINKALQKLSNIERKSLELKYKSDLTNAEIADNLGIKTAKVNRTLKTSIEKLKHYIKD
jgi:RNA polymerase sigma-B factor